MNCEKCGTEIDPDYNDWPEIIAWCEFYQDTGIIDHTSLCADYLSMRIDQMMEVSRERLS